MDVHTFFMRGPVNNTLSKELSQSVVKVLCRRRMQLDGDRGEDNVQLLADDVLHLRAELRKVSVQVAQQHLLPAMASHLQLCKKLACLCDTIAPVNMEVLLPGPPETDQLGWSGPLEGERHDAIKSYRTSSSREPKMCACSSACKT